MHTDDLSISEHIDQYTYTGVMLIFVLLLTAGFGGFTTYAIYIRSHWLPSSCERSEAVFLNVYGAQESIPRNEFRHPM
jgi:hypothetical protein